MAGLAATQEVLAAAVAMAIKQVPQEHLEPVSAVVQVATVEQAMVQLVFLVVTTAARGIRAALVNLARQVLTD
jgi:hypothetical protein